MADSQGKNLADKEFEAADKLRKKIKEMDKKK